MNCRTPRAVIALVLALACGCRHQPSGADAQLTALEQRYAETSQRVDQVAVDLDRLTTSQRQVLATYNAAQTSWSASAALLREAQSQSEAAKRTFDRAAADYEVATRNFRIATLAMVTIAAGSMLCGSTLKTSQYRTQLRRDGINLQGKDIDHIFPKSRGGIDHPLNYQVLNSSLNRSLGNDLVAKFMQAPVGFIVGMAASALAVISCH